MCTLLSSFLHPALDLRISPEETPNLFSIIPATSSLSDSPTFTEPFWRGRLGVQVFSTEAGGTWALFSLLLGLAVLSVGVGGVWKVRRELEEKKVV